VTIRVLVVDDQVMIRDGLATLLSAAPDIEVVGLAGDGRAAVELCGQLGPDVVVMDVRMPVLDGLAATAEIVGGQARAGAGPCGAGPVARAQSEVDAGSVLPGPKVLILTTFDLDEYVYEALRAGASGFMLKDAPATELVHAVRVVAAGEALLSPAVTRRLIAEFAARSRPARGYRGLAELTPREREVVELVAAGLSNEQIAARIHVSQSTVKTHAARAMTKLGARDRAQLVVAAYQSGLVRPDWAG
jgi:DNA-binding NarL/FixJ family response regulator